MESKEALKRIFEGKKPHEIAIIVGGSTGFRTTLIDELTEVETERIMRAYSPRPLSERGGNPAEDMDLIRAWRSNVLTVASRIAIKSPENFTGFNHWMKAKSIYKKELFKLSLQELKDTHRQLLALEKNEAKSAKNFGTRAYWQKADKRKNLN